MSAFILYRDRFLNLQAALRVVVPSHLKHKYMHVYGYRILKFRFRTLFGSSCYVLQQLWFCASGDENMNIMVLFVS